MRDGLKTHMVPWVMTVTRAEAHPRMFTREGILNQKMMILQGVQRIAVKSLMPEH
jgi:hypothetical protein